MALSELCSKGVIDLTVLAELGESFQDDPFEDARISKPFLRVFFEALEDNLLEFHRDIRLDLSGRPWFKGKNQIHQDLFVVVVKR